MEFGVGSIGIASLLVSVGTQDSELDGVVDILTSEFADPVNYAEIVGQARAALARFRERAVDTQPDEAESEPLNGFVLQEVIAASNGESDPRSGE